jgi:membrane protease YdiL (CAAX protease family)
VVRTWLAATGTLVSFPMLPLVVLLASEGSLYGGFEGIALWGYVATVAVCVLAPLRFPEELAVSRAIVVLPVFRLVDLTMPVFDGGPHVRVVIVYAILAVAVGVLVARARPRWAGFQRPELLWLPAMLPIAVGLAYAGYLLVGTAPTLATTLAADATTTILVVVLVALVEEPVFRGALQGQLQERLNPAVGLVVASVVYGAMHAALSPEAAAFGLVSGLVFGTVYWYWDSIALPTLLHALVGVLAHTVVPL